MGPLTFLKTLRASWGTSNFPVSVEYLTSSKGVPGVPAGGEKLGSTVLGFLPPKKNDIADACYFLDTSRSFEVPFALKSEAIAE